VIEQLPAGIDRQRFSAAIDVAQRMVADNVLPALAICIVRSGELVGPLAFGRRRLATESSLLPDDRFVVASLTKPIVAMGILRLAEQGRLSLNDRVVEFISEYDDAPRRATTIRHLLTHTSGLPDMLPNNLSLRRSHAPLSRFVAGACGVSLDFSPGRGVQYQSLGYALLGAIIERIADCPCGEFLRAEFFDPLDMHDTTLGLPLENGPDGFPTRLAEIRVPDEMAGGDNWNWNSAYWRGVGAPWGGLVSTAGDLARYCAMMLGRGQLHGIRTLSPATVDAATTNQLEGFHDLPEPDRRTRPWGFGWRMNWPAHAASFGDFLSTCAYGHWGATGTLFWIDPQRDCGVVLLSTQPMERDRSPLVRLSNSIASAFFG
jgi:CubicO group peptidase (beta-lactamase class C family)